VKVVATNRKAKHDYIVIDTYEAGIVLVGGEVKSLRQGNVSMSDAYGDVYNGEVFLFNLHISAYKHSTIGKSEPKRKRKLLLNSKEIKKLYGLIQQRGNTLIPLKIYFNDNGYAKVTLGACRRKRLYDKKEKILKNEIERKVAKIKKAVR
jgi:SsrA-binding protein